MNSEYQTTPPPPPPPPPPFRPTFIYIIRFTYHFPTLCRLHAENWNIHPNNGPRWVRGVVCSDNIYYRPIYEGLEKILVVVFSLCALGCARVMAGGVGSRGVPPPPLPSESGRVSPIAYIFCDCATFMSFENSPEFVI